MPAMPPIVLNMIEDIENILSPQSRGITPPMVDPMNIPIQIKGREFMHKSITLNSYMCVFILAIHRIEIHCDSLLYNVRMDIQYNSDSSYQRPQYSSPQSKSALVSFLMKKGVAKTEGQANIILITFIVVGFAITIHTIFFR